MKWSRRNLVKAGVATPVLATLASRAYAAGGEGSPFEGLEGLEDFWLATDAYVYGYPLVTMEMTRRVMTNIAKPEGSRAPMGQLIKMRTYPSPSFTDVTAPNADTLYTTSFFDVGKEPWVLSLPDLKGRYALFPLLDGWTNVFEVPGKRTPAPLRRLTRSPGRAGADRCRPA